MLVGAAEPEAREGSGRAGPGRAGSEGGGADLVKWAGRRTRERELTAQACAKVQSHGWPFSGRSRVWSAPGVLHAQCVLSQ